MLQTKPATRRIFLVSAFLATATLFVLGCASTLPAPAPETIPALNIKSVVVLPFNKSTERCENGMSVRCPVCGAIFQTGPVEIGAESFMTEQLVALVTEKTGCTLIPPGTAEGVRSRILAGELQISERGLLVGTGKELRADAVINGTIYRFQQRMGTSLSVDKPASVAFGIHLIRVADSRLIWVGHFDETQQSLSENLFKLASFIKRGGGWLTVEELATFGLRETMATFPLH